MSRNVEKAGSPAPPVVVGPTEEIFLSMARNLIRRPCFHIISRNPSPVSFPHFLEP